LERGTGFNDQVVEPGEQKDKPDIDQDEPYCSFTENECIDQQKVINIEDYRCKQQEGPIHSQDRIERKLVPGEKQYSKAEQNYPNKTV
jgi:hypothetical protein